MVLSFRIGHVLTRFSGACHQQGSCLVWELGAFGSLQHAVLTCFIIFLKSSFPKTQSESALFYGQRAVCWCCGSWVHLRSPWAVQVCEWVDGPRSRRPAPSTTTVGANRFPNLAMGIHGGLLVVRNLQIVVVFFLNLDIWNNLIWLAGGSQTVVKVVSTVYDWLLPRPEFGKFFLACPLMLSWKC